MHHPASPAPPRPDAGALRVLLVEDETGDAELLIERLQDEAARGTPITVQRMDRLEPALALLADPRHDARPDVVLLDLQLPDSRGLDTVRRTRAVAPDVPIVVLTGIAQQELAVQAVQAGAQDYLVKGRGDGDVLLRAIRYAIERERLWRDARLNEVLFRTAVESAPIGKALVGIDGRWRLVNRALCELTGLAESELVGRSFADVTHPADLDADLEHVARLLRGEARSYAMEKRFVRGDGSVVWALLTVSLVRDEGGQPLYFITQVQDLTERRRAAERTQHLLAITAALTDARTPQDVADRITTRVVETLGAEAASVGIVLPDGDVRMLARIGPPEEYAHDWSRFPVTAPVPLAEALRTRQPLWIESPRELTERFPEIARGPSLARIGAFAVLPLMLGDAAIGAIAIGYAAPQHFVPEDRVMLEAVAHQCALALERARLFEAEQEASAAARAASEAKSRFLAVMSHELRTPLASITGFAELIAEGAVGPVTEQQSAYLGRVATSAGHLLRMINDILSLSRLEAGREEAYLEPVLVGDAVREAADLVEVAAAAKGLALGVEIAAPELVVTTDVVKLRQILINLLGNAVKFTDAGRVDVRVEDRGAHVAIVVSDTGVGIAPEHLAHVFDAFWQADQRARRRAGGTGLGLDVSLRFARLLGGDIRVHSTPGRGSTFTLLLPGAGA